MKNLFLSLFAIMALFSTSCKQSPTQATVSGSMDSYEKLDYMLCLVDTPEGVKGDTVAVQADGTFKHVLTLEKPMKIDLFLEYLDSKHSVVSIFAANGTESKVKITHSQDETGRLIPSAEFYGDNKVESEFIKTDFRLMVGYDLGLETAAGFKTFKEYNTAVKEKIDELRTLLNKAKNAEFKADKSKKLDLEEKTIPFRFVVAKSDGERMDADANFVAYIKSFDLNDTVNLVNGITERVLRWYEGCEPNPDNEGSTLRLMKSMKRLVGNQEVINILSTKLIKTVFTMGGREDLKDIHDQYVQINTDKATQEEIAPLYNQLVKLVKGTPATDFEMQDVKGKTVRFFDVVGKGKVVYIDFWATWCGPCCAEIPYIEKFVEKYKNNPNLEFISISMDRDLEKWHKKLNNDKPQWKQFVIPDNFNSAFAKEYNILAIPRFMIFDKEGKIISANAPRPSHQEIEAFIQPYIQ